MMQPLGDMKLPDPEAFSKNMVKIASRSQQLVGDFLARQAENGGGANPDPLNIGKAFMEMTTRMMADPVKLASAQMQLWQDYVSLWQNATLRWLNGGLAAPTAEPEPSDKRFKDPAWRDNAIFDYIKQSYLLTARWMQKTVKDVDGLDDKTSKKVEFYTRQFVDALAPTNFVATNPEVLKATLESNGENLVRGLDNMLADLERGKGQLQIRMTDMDKFKIGENVAVSKGKVVAQSDLMQLIQYEPATEKVYKRPLLIVPPWINKFYILDLRPENSFIKWAVERGYTVFVVSWVNPDTKLSKKTFEDYMFEGVLAAADAVEKASGEREMSIIGYCLGGTLTAATLAYMKAKGDDRIKAATFFTALVDFKEAGELQVFIDEEQLKSLEQRMEKDGYLDGKAMATTFNMLRANDLIWSFVVNNYLLGKEPFPFDLLYWNSDSTRMPKAMHSFYLRKMYQENLLSKPNGIELGGVKIDLRTVDIPVIIVSAKEDHIAPWKATYVATQLYGGETRFLLGGSGHIAGIVNPPTPVKYQHWTNDKNPAKSDDWLAGAEQHPGSWWPTWDAWLAKHSGSKVKARMPGDGKLKPIEDAPGSYVKVRAI